MGTDDNEDTMNTLCIDEELGYSELVANPDHHLQKIEAKLQNVENVGESLASLKTLIQSHRP